MIRTDRTLGYKKLLSMSLIFLLWGCVVTAQVPRESGPQHSPRGQYSCEEYARIAVRQNEQNIRRNCRFTGPRWNSDYNGHYQWCVSVSWQAADAETKAREEELQYQCRDKQSSCDEYARIAVRQNDQNMRRNCGFTGTRWSSNYNEHYQWCLFVPLQTSDSEMKAREEELQHQCRDKQSSCNEYARTAVAQNEQNIRRRCRFTGTRWSSNYNEHYQWCLSVPLESADSETRAREEELRHQCR